MDGPQPPTDASARSSKQSPRHVQLRRESQQKGSRRPTLKLSHSLLRDVATRQANKSVDDPKKTPKQPSEQSPLLKHNRKDQDGGDLPSDAATATEWNPFEATLQETKSSWYLMLLTLAIGGLQIAWSVELSNGSPYLLGLGISKSLLAFVWIAGPLSGTLVQPYVGLKSDRCRSKWGKRRPFMVAGAIATVLSLMGLAWARELIGSIGALFGIPPESESTQLACVVFAILMIYVLDFSINCIQAGTRAYIVDNAPTHQQDSANAWASRMSGVGNIIGYLFGYVDLPKYFWFFGDTQFKILCVIASLAMFATLSVTFGVIGERDPRPEGDPGKEEGGLLNFFKGLWRSILKLPPQIRAVCLVQFCAWIGWFPFLFYITTWIGEIYVTDQHRENPYMTPTEIDQAYERGTRLGTFALLVFALATFTASVFLPFIIAQSYKAPQTEAEPPGTPGPPGTPNSPGFRTPEMSYVDSRTPKTPLTPHTPGGASTASYFGYQPAHTDDLNVRQHPEHMTFLQRLFARLPNLEIKSLTLKRAWMLSHIVFALLMWLTFLADTTLIATTLVGLVGIPWAMTNWAPFALIAAEISKRDQIRHGVIPPPPTRDGHLLAAGEDPAEGADHAGVVLGIHNLFIAAPQVIATLASSLIFKGLQKPRGTIGDDSVAWVLRFGGLAPVAAAFMTRKVREEDEEGEEEDEGED
ncbi:hypothetical protein KC357_g917 [Hortaea werneckii]|nr:hypothetical protein KC357_g917 [Hortaea werneckii]